MSALELFHPAVRDWFAKSFAEPTRAQEIGWPAIARGEWTLITAPTGSGKTLTAFLYALDRLMFTPRPPKERRCRVVYVSPLKALAVDVERTSVAETPALVPNRRGAHLALSLGPLAMLGEREPQRIGLSATQNPI